MCWPWLAELFRAWVQSGGLRLHMFHSLRLLHSKKKVKFPEVLQGNFDRKSGIQIYELYDFKGISALSYTTLYLKYQISCQISL